jgi:DNA excision repair protein ERCC-8
MDLAKLLRQRETTDRSRRLSPAMVERERSKTFDLSTSRVFDTSGLEAGTPGVTSIDLDPVEGRYLLAGGNDGTVCAFDVLSHYYTEASREVGSSQRHRKLKTFVHKHVFRLPSSSSSSRHGSSGGYNAAITGLQWYPVDSGLFLTASKDCSVKLVDANELSTVCSCRQDFEINCASMPTNASGHCLIAIASRSPVIRLWDPRSDCISLNFAGHIGKEVTTLTWSSSSEWLLVSGGSEGQIRVWDVRKANSLLALDQYNTKNYSEALAPLPDVDHLKRKRLKTPQGDDVFGEKFNRNLQEWVSSRKLVKKFSDAKRNDTASAHDSAVRLLQTSRDGLFLYSAASKMTEMRKWDLSSGKNMLVHYELPAPGYKRVKCGQIASSGDGQTLFVPHGNFLYQIHSITGKRLAKMSAHYDLVTSCVVNRVYCEMYTCSLDGSILVWEPELLKRSEEEKEENGKNAEETTEFANQDEWTTDEEL